ncbi:hypothetical protein [Uliginosibacterium sediminicola]|uniref:DUF1353 domain-containing protein n=1 Tax=Uliginosibacterium sediminicola TaxID=2024550 RepID=A0ABU9YUJ4_9RHOO
MQPLFVKWIYVLPADYALNIRPHLPADFRACAFEDGFGRRWLELDADGTLRVLKGYAWDGCTPKLRLFGRVIGMPDGGISPVTQLPRAYYASLVHDALYQFLDTGLPVDRVTADRIFQEILLRDEFSASLLYYLAVRIFGRATLFFLRRQRGFCGRMIAAG